MSSTAGRSEGEVICGASAIHVTSRQRGKHLPSSCTANASAAERDELICAVPDRRRGHTSVTWLARAASVPTALRKWLSRSVV